MDWQAILFSLAVATPVLILAGIGMLILYLVVWLICHMIPVHPMEGCYPLDEVMAWADAVMRDDDLGAKVE